MRRQNPFDSFYKSPFVQRAEQKAQVRAKEALVALKRMRSINSEITIGEWNSDVKTNHLFDPELKKVELFVHKSPKREEVRTPKVSSTIASPKEIQTNTSTIAYSSTPRTRINKIASSTQSPTRSIISSPGSEKRRLGKTTLRVSSFPIRRPTVLESSNHSSTQIKNKAPVATYIPKIAPPVVPTVASNRQYTKPTPGPTHAQTARSSSSHIHVNETIRTVHGGITRSTSPFDENVVKLLLGDSLEEEAWASVRPRRTISSTISATVVNDRGRVSRGNDVIFSPQFQKSRGSNGMNIDSESNFLVDDIEHWYPEKGSVNGFASEYDSCDEPVRPLEEVVEQMRRMLVDTDAETARIFSRSSSRPISASSARLSVAADEIVTKKPSSTRFDTQPASTNESSYSLPAEQVQWLQDEIEQLKLDLAAVKEKDIISSGTQATHVLPKKNKKKIIQVSATQIKEFELYKLNILK